MDTTNKTATHSVNPLSAEGFLCFMSERGTLRAPEARAAARVVAGPGKVIARTSRGMLVRVTREQALAVGMEIVG